MVVVGEGVGTVVFPFTIEWLYNSEVRSIDICFASCNVTGSGSCTVALVRFSAY